MPTFTTSHNNKHFCRVNKRRPCLICGKSDWCSYSANEVFSICMRVRQDAVKINRQGGAIFVHENSEAQFNGTPHHHALTTTPLAPLEVRDFAYRWLIEHSPATRYHGELIAAPRGLLARGFSTRQCQTYGALPRSVRERDQLTRQLWRATAQQFPGCISLNGVPGFWEDEHGAHLWQPHHDRSVRLLIPVRDELGRIQACQLRNTSLRHGSARSTRYCWLSSTKWPNGCGSGSPLHFNFALDALQRATPIWIVEGFLKADAFAALRPPTPIIATGGVAANHNEIIRSTQRCSVVIGYDQDSQLNEMVCLQLARLMAARISSEGTAETTRIAIWSPRAKGIDDAALLRLPIELVSCEDWLRHLPLSFRSQVTAEWHERRITLPSA